MRWFCIAPVILLVFACDNKQDAPPGTTSASSATPPASAAVSAHTSGAALGADAGTGGTATGEASAKAASALVMPERPIPKPQTTVGSGMPIEVQQKAIAYMVAMRAPRVDDPAADPVYAGDLATKLKPISMSMDTGADKRLNRVDVVANGRQIDVLMAGGCDHNTPLRIVQTRAGVPLNTLAQHGVLVIRCNDARIQCLQSTRDPDDILCTTAPRHK